MVTFGPGGMRRARPPGATPPFDYRGANVADWPPGPETIRRLKELLAKLEAGGAEQDVINAVEAKIIQLGPRGSRPVTTPPPHLRTQAMGMTHSPSPNTIARAEGARLGTPTGLASGSNPHTYPASLVAQSKVQASDQMKAAWKKLLTPGEHLEVQAGVERHLRSIKPQQMQLFHPAGELRGVTPNDWLASIAGTGNPAGTTGTRPPQFTTGTLPPPGIEDVWADKLKEAKRNPQVQGPGHGAGLHESIKASGVRRPIQLGHQEGGLPRRIMEGHHRVAAAADINPAMEVPVKNQPYGLFGRMQGLPDRRIQQIVPNEDIVRQLAKFSRKWGRNALRLMLKIPK
jgi:hypothetical protein